MFEHWRRLTASIVTLVASLYAGLAVAAQPTHAIVFATPASPELEASLRDALTAQLSGSDALVVFERLGGEGEPLRAQVSEARSLASAHDAVGVFWVDTVREGDWLLYLAEPAGERVLVRRIVLASGSGAVAAAVEAVAVITRQSTEALLAGQTIGMTPVEEPLPPVLTPADVPREVPVQPVRPPRPASPPPERHLSMSVGYYGDTMARNVAWQSGVLLGAAYRFGNGLYLGASYVAFRELRIDSKNLALGIERTPLQATLGMAFGHGRLVPALELRGIAEVLGREVIRASAPLESRPGSTRVVLFLGPRFRLECNLAAGVRAYLAAGVDVAMNRFSFVSRIDDQPEAVVDPWLVRPAAEVGLSVWP